MRPIEERVDGVFWEALKCVEYRIPRAPELRRPGALLALGLRYGLTGASAAHFLILTATEEESEDLSELFCSWPALVEQHVRFVIRDRLPFAWTDSMPSLMGKLAMKPLKMHLSQHPELVPVRRCLEIVLEEFLLEHEPAIVAGWPMLGRRKARRLFAQLGWESLEFAQLFYERRECGIEEVPEIALIGD
jgi:hypothetical protein